MLKKFLKFLLILVILGLGRLSFEFAAELPILELNRIQLLGNWDISADSAATVAGLEKGKSILKQDLKFALERIMRQPGIVSCDIERQLPATIKINVRAAEPLLLINASTFMSISREGMVLPLNDNMQVLPFISGKKFTGIKCYELLRDSDIVTALSLYDKLLYSAPNLCASLSEIYCEGNGALRLYFSPDGTEIIIDNSNLSDSVMRLSMLNKSNMINDRKKLDLRFGPVILETVNDKGKT